jgi:hypothetical protein
VGDGRMRGWLEGQEWRNKARFAKRTLRRVGLVPQPAVYRRLSDGYRALPVPAKVRKVISTVVLRRPWRVRVPIDRLLLGAPAGWTPWEFAERTDNLLWPSTRLVDGPHVDLLRHENPDDEEILQSPYGRMARRCVDAGGTYLGATNDAEIVAVARAFLDDDGAADPNGEPNQVLVAPIRASDCFQVIEGHHRLAHAAARGETSIRVRARWIPVSTPLQDLLLRMSWLDGSRELYQPIDSPELRKSWTTVRRCTDRLEKMQNLLSERQITGSYLDVASCYGWFVAAMGRAGFDAYGMEYDSLAVPLGRAVYDLSDGQVVTGDATELLASTERTWDVVSCFSLLHHFVLDRRSVSPEVLVKLLDRVTNEVLFIDTGQEHEQWLRKDLSGWSPTFIAEYLRRNTTFDTIIDLGSDEDARPPYAANYGRHLFACVRG